MVELLMGLVSVLYTNPNNLIPPLVQDRNVCTTQAIYECEVVSGGMHQGTPESYADGYGRKIRTTGAKFPLVAKRANKKGIARIDQVRDIKKYKKYIKQEGRYGLISIRNYQEKDKYFVVEGDKPTQGHAMCAIGIYEYEGKEWIIARNTVGDAVGVMGYFFVDPDTVNEMFTFKNR